MCCGVAQNSYHTIDSIRVVLHDGSVLDTSDGASITEFSLTHASLLAGLAELASQTRSNDELNQLISHKYRLKKYHRLCNQFID